MPPALKEAVTLYMLNRPDCLPFIVCPKDWKYISLRRKAFLKQEQEGMFTIPVFVISFNQLTYVKQMVEGLEKMGCRRIIIIDNASTYKPLLEYYTTIDHEVIRMDKNWKHTVFWDAPELQKFRNDFYVVTDPDLDISQCPSDSIRVLFDVLKKYPYIRKAGFSLRLDDLPEDTESYQNIMAWEQQFNRFYDRKRNIYFAKIDTTFALYLPESLVLNENFFSAVRTGAPYQARHLPWYKRPAEATNEDIFYYDHKDEKVGHWNIVRETVPEKEKGGSE